MCDYALWHGMCNIIVHTGSGGIWCMLCRNAFWRSDLRNSAAGQ